MYAIEFKFGPGDKVKHKVLEFVGIVRACDTWITGCKRYGIMRPLKEDGTTHDMYWAEEQDVELVEAKEKIEQSSTKGKPMVKSLDEAMEWFLVNSSGTLICHNGSAQKAINSYPEAVDFFNTPSQTAERATENGGPGPFLKTEGNK
jgi:hypothetical protein